MWSNILKTISFIGMMHLLLWNAPIASGQQYTIPWFTIDSGGGYSAGSAFELEGTIGPPDAGPVMTGGTFEVSGGFWVGTSVQVPVEIVADTLLVTRGEYYYESVTIC